MAIDIPSLFRDVIETPEQRQRRKLSEAVALAPHARGGIASLLNPLAQATSINLQQGSEGLGRSVGGMLGLDMRDTSQKVSDELLGADLSSSTCMRDLSKAINRYAPAQAIGLLQAADEREQAEAAAEAASVTRNLNQTLTGLEINEKLTDLAETEDQETTQESLRNTYVNQINNSTVLGEAEKNILINQVNAGAFDGKTDDIRSITSPKPLVVGGKAMIPTPNGWQEMAGMSDDDSLGVNKTTALKASAALQYGVDSENYKIIEQGIEANLITAANDFSKYVKPSEPEERLNIPSSVEEWNQEGLANQTAAEESDRRIDSVMNLILSENLLDQGSAGAYSTLKAAFKNFTGTRDFESFARTAYTRERNTEIINSLPPGVASDRDIAIFSEGFPRDDSSIAEVYEFLQAAKRVNSYVRDEQNLKMQFIDNQRKEGIYKDATTIGFSAFKNRYGDARKVLRMEENKLRAMVGDGPDMISPQEFEQRMGEEIDGFRSAFGFVPSMYK